MISLALLVLLLAANGMLVWIVKARVFAVEGWVSPLALFLATYVLNYPLRAAALYFGSGTTLENELGCLPYGFTVGEIGVGLLYSTLFAIVLVGIYGAMVRRRGGFDFPAYVRQSAAAVSPWRLNALNALLGLYLTSFAYRAATHSLFGLYEELGDLKRSAADNIIALADTVKWPLLAFAFLRLMERKTPSAILHAGAITATIVYGSLVSTAKGEIVSVLLLWAICFWLKRGKLPWSHLLAGAAATMAFAYYSMIIRVEGTVTKRGDEAAEAFSENQARFAEHWADNAVGFEHLVTLSSRFSYLDAVILAQRNGTFLTDGLYCLGSPVELANIVPRALWPDRPLLSFNHEMTHVVWGLPEWDFFAEVPVGRIGESFFVLNWMGLLYAPFYAVFWNWIYRRWFVMARDDLSRAFYLSMLILFIFPDAYVVYNWKLLPVLAVAGYVLGADFSGLARPVKAEARPAALPAAQRLPVSRAPLEKS